ncbi:MAG TPA: response regulator transcription factor [Egibacteraceae bacterium]|nr:response regulator transcription factor [Egibacteraceae bacterium]
MRERAKVFLVDDHALFRAGIRSEIADRVWICGEAADVPAAVAGIVAHAPDVVLLDVHLPTVPGAGGGTPWAGGDQTGGRAVIEGVRAAGSDARFLALSASDSPEDVIGLVRAGARGYVTKTVSADELVDGIRRVASGDAVFSPQLAGYVLDAFAAIPVAQVDDDLATLTRREREVLQHVARGYTYREIAEQLFISVKTVETHVSAVLRKLQLPNRHQLSRWAAEHNIR